MIEKLLFRNGNNNWVSNISLLKSLEQVDAHKCNILFIHSALTFGIPNPSLSKNEILQAIIDTLMELNVPTICFPTFTFSFCNGYDFDISNSKSKMGVLNEYFRKQPKVIRSLDPLMSIAMLGEDIDLADGIGHNSIGKDSTFDKLHNRNNVKFLFLGTRPGDCYTYMHYIEDYVNVPYRYNRDFTGTIITPEKTYIDTFTLFVRYKNIKPGNGSYTYEEILEEKGIAKKTSFGDNFITSVEEPKAFDIYCELVKQDPNYFIDPSSVFDYDKTFEVKDMVAL